MDTHNLGESSGLGSLRPDLCLYDKDIVHEMSVQEQGHRSNLGVSEVVVEVKKDEAKDPFRDPVDVSSAAQNGFIAEFNGIGKSILAKRCLGQISLYVA